MHYVKRINIVAITVLCFLIIKYYTKIVIEVQNCTKLQIRIFDYTCDEDWVSWYTRRRRDHNVL